MTSNQTTTEKPLAGAAKVSLIVAAGATIILFYLFAFISILVLLAFIIAELGLVIASLRFGGSRLFIGILTRHVELLTLFLRSFWLRKGVEFRLPLQEHEAPRLFAILKKLCQRLEIEVPEIVSLEMSMNAWVLLRGFRRGSAKTTLGIGYDLLAGLTEAELEAVLAHEMVHAKLVRRGLKRWLNSGLSRVAKLTNTLSQLVEAHRRARQTFVLGETFLTGADRITRLAARLIATYSRQDEFDADRGAAEICGSDPMLSSLMKVESLSRITARLPWRERVAQLQGSESFSQWLLKEFAAAEALTSAADAPEVFNNYSTHPLLRDRLAAIPVTLSEAKISSAPALALLNNPDQAAGKLIAEIHRAMVDEEQKDSKLLSKWSNKAKRTSHLRPMQTAGVVVALIGAAVGIAISTAAFVVGLMFIAVALAIAYAFYRAGRHRDRFVLPVPTFAAMKKHWRGESQVKDMAAVQKELEVDLSKKASAETKPRQKVQFYAIESYNALERCDFLHAHVAARLCLRADKKSVEGTMALAIASAALGQNDQAGWTLAAVQRMTALATPSVVWGSAWALLLAGDWARAEALLNELLRKKPDKATWLILHAVCQAQRGKLQGALASARAAFERDSNIEIRKFLVTQLLNAGQRREAQERLTGLESQCRQDKELMFLMVRLRLMQRQFDSAAEWASLVKETAADAQVLVDLAEAYEVARKNDEAGALFQQALEKGFYPEACLGLARLEAEKQNKPQARCLIFEALNMRRTLGERAQGPLPVFRIALGQLLTLEDPAPNCRAWIATLTGGISPVELAHQSFVIFATDRPNAERWLHNVLNALQPGTPPLLPTQIQWREAPREQQPVAPVRPGIQSIFH